MSASISITETDVFTALRALILSIIDCEVIRGLVNRVATPRNGFIAITPNGLLRMATNTTTYNPQQNQQFLQQNTQITIQIDCYGKQSADWAVMLMTVLRSEYASTVFTDSGFDIQPLYASEPNQLPLVDGEQQYEERWMLQAILQSNPVTTLPQQFADELGPTGIISVDAVYPPH